MLKQYGFNARDCSAAAGLCIWLLSKEAKQRLGNTAPEPSARGHPKPTHAAKAVVSGPSKNILPLRKMKLLPFVYHFTLP